MQNSLKSFYIRTLLLVVLISSMILISFGMMQFNKAMNLISKDLEVRFYTFENSYINQLSSAVEKIKFLKNFILKNSDVEKQRLENKNEDIITFASKKIEDHFVTNLSLSDSNNTIFLVDKADKIVYSTRHDIMPSKKERFSGTDLSDRDYLSKNKQNMDKIHIGSLVKGAISHNWVIPVSSAIIDSGKYQGSIIFTVPLSEFSKENIASDIRFTSIKILGKEEELEIPNQVIYRFENHKLYGGFSLFYKLFIQRVDHISFCYDLSSLEQKAYADVSSKDLREKILNSFISDFLLLSIFIVFCIAILALLGTLVFKPLEAIDAKIKLIEPSFLELLPQGSYARSKTSNIDFIQNTALGVLNISSGEMRNIKAFVDKSVELIDHAKNQQAMILKKNAQLASMDILHKKFSSIFLANKEKHLMFAEELKDLIDRLNLGAAKEMIFRSIVEIYDMHQKEIKKTEFLDESFKFAIDAIADGKHNIDIALASRDYFMSKITNITIDDMGRVAIPTLVPCFSTALLLTLQHMHMAILNDEKESSESSKTSLETSLTLSINASSKSIDDTDLGISIELSKQKKSNSVPLEIDATNLYKAKIYALLNDGIIDVYYGSDEVAITLILKRDYNYSALDKLKYK
jgi:hypothetical protein